MSSSAKQPMRFALHEHYSFLDPSLKFDSRAQFVELTRDIVQGIGLCMELVHSSHFQRSALLNDPELELPLLSEAQTEFLTRFAIASASLLSEKAEQKISFLNKLAKEGRMGDLDHQALKDAAA